MAFPFQVWVLPQWENVLRAELCSCLCRCVWDRKTNREWKYMTDLSGTDSLRNVDDSWPYHTNCHLIKIINIIINIIHVVCHDYFFYVSDNFTQLQNNPANRTRHGLLIFVLKFSVLLLAHISYTSFLWIYSTCISEDMYKKCIRNYF